MRPMYEIPADMSGEMHVSGFDRIAYDLTAGEFTPDSPELEAVCERLLEAGIIALAPKPTKTKPAPVGPVKVEE